MPLSIQIAVCTIILGCLAQPARAQETSILETRDAVRQMAFDPATFFPSPYIKDRSVIRITYTGDDYGWPVYAIAIAEGCIDQENVRQDDCKSRLRARMVRAPAPPNLTRARQRGVHLVTRLVERGATSPELMRTALDQLGVEWLEADLRTCSGAMETLQQSTEAVWVPDAVSDPTPDDEMAGLVLHADIVQVEIQQYARRTTYVGWLAAGSPAVWAEALATVLEPCWRPANVSVPWSAPD